MLIHKCKLMVVTSCKFKNSFLQLKLNNDNEFSIDNYEGPLFKCGRFCIINLNSKNKISNMYLLDSNDTPFQVYGKIDILEEGCVIYDNTKELSKDNAYAKQICINAFNCLFKREIENNKELLLELENYIFDFIMNNNLGWKNSKKRIIEMLNTFLLPKDILDRMSEHINIAPMPKTAINRKANVNLEYYPESAFVKF